MQIALSKLLTVFVLLSSTIWPVLSYCDQHEQHARVLAQMTEAAEFDMTNPAHTPDNSIPGNGSDCDHCCHATLHLLGCFMSYQQHAPLNSNQPLLFTLNNYNSLSPSPPYHPPTV